jgi:PAP2 superfamily
VSVPGRLQRVLTAAALSSVLLSSVAVALPERAGASPGSAENAATRWMQRALDAVRSGSPAAHTSTPGAARTYAMTTAAMYDAVNGIDVANGASSRGRALVASYGGAPPGGNRDAAACAAAHAVLASLFAANATVKDSLDQALAGELAALGSDPAVESGRAWGASVGNEVVSRRSSDGTQTSTSQPGGSGPGVFPRTFSGTQFRNMVPFGIATAEPYLSSGPPPLTSTAYADAFNEVKEIGSLDDTNAERAAIARQWLAEAGTVRETGLWFKVALAVVAEQGTAASLSDTVRLLALLGMGTADAVVTSWNDKFNWHYWRPGDAIRQASTDGNPATDEDPGWNPRSGACAIGADLASCSTFGGTPEHTSGTSVFGGTASTILASFYCRDRIAFSFAGEQPGSTARSYSKFSEAAREAGRSRIYGGIHFQFSNDAGRTAGKGIGREIVRTRLLAAGSKPKADCPAQAARSRSRKAQ